jgi:hypothetical protein
MSVRRKKPARKTSSSVSKGALYGAIGESNHRTDPSLSYSDSATSMLKPGATGFFPLREVLRIGREDREDREAREVTRVSVEYGRECATQPNNCVSPRHTSRKSSLDAVPESMSESAWDRLLDPPFDDTARSPASRGMLPIGRQPHTTAVHTPASAQASVPTHSKSHFTNVPSFDVASAPSPDRESVNALTTFIDEYSLSEGPTETPTSGTTVAVDQWLRATKSKTGQEEDIASPFIENVKPLHLARQLARRSASFVDTLLPQDESHLTHPSAPVETFVAADAKHDVLLGHISKGVTLSDPRSRLLAHHAMLERLCTDANDMLRNETFDTDGRLDLDMVMMGVVETIDEEHVLPTFRTDAIGAVAYLMSEVDDLPASSAVVVLQHRRETWIAKANAAYLTALPNANDSHGIASALSAVISTARNDSLRHHAGQFVTSSKLLHLEGDAERQSIREVVAKRLTQIQR